MKLSIITVNLNNLEGLKKTYDSVVCQTFTDYEWLVIDGGSTDGSREFIEQHQDKFAYWCSEPDKGIYNAMNKGIVRAKGEYLNFMNSGDCFASNDTLIRVLVNERNEDIIYGYMALGHITGPLLANATREKIFWYDLFPSTLPHQASFIRKKLFDIVGFYDEDLKVVSDSRWFAMAILNYGATYKFLPIIIAIFENGGISRISDFSAERAKQKKDIFPDYIREEDAMNLVILSMIHSFRWTSFMFKVLKIIALRMNSYRRRKTALF